MKPQDQIHILPKNIERNINDHVVRPFSRERQNFVEVNSKLINHPSNINIYEKKQVLIQQPISLVIPCGIPSRNKAP